MVYVFLGKGGVGKTTMAGSLAWSLAEVDPPVFVLSIDPAHNLLHLYGLPSQAGEVTVKEGLVVEEPDINTHIKTLLEDTSRKMKDTYKYLQVLNLEGLFDILKYSPGLQEWAALKTVVERLRKWSTTAKHIVIDTPPTGLALRFLSLPFTGTLWIEKLLGLRKRILQNRDEVLRIKGPADGPPFYHTPETDPVTGILQEEFAQLTELKQTFSDTTSTKLSLVLNYDELSVHEGMNIIDALRAFGLKLSLVIFNKATMGQKGPLVDRLLEKVDSSVLEIPFYTDRITSGEFFSDIGAALEEALRE